MRPLRLELSGFTAFREPVVVDFEGCEYFALCGPTGSGKSSIIDAITFALYGSVPRLGSSQVAPVISQGLLEAKVRLDFAVDDVVYTAVRVVARTKTGATTREARLQRGDDVIAGNADALSHEVERLLGLAYEHFTTCVVLPQGEAAKFLHAKPADRGELLAQVLGMQVYRTMGQRAREIANAASRQIEWWQKRLDEDLNFATDESRAAAAERLAALDALWARIEEAKPRSDELLAEEQAARDAAKQAEERAARLRSLRIPDGVEELGDIVVRARAARDEAATALAAAEAAASAAEEALAALPRRETLELAKAAHTEHAKISAALGAAQAAAAQMVAAEAAATKTVDEATERARTALDDLEHARLANRASELARTLVAGDPCPVCKQTVAEAPHDEPPPELAAAEAAAQQARAALDAAAAAQRKAEKDRAAAEARVHQLDDSLASLSSKIAEHPDLAAVESAIARADAAERAAAAARAAERAARDAAQSAQRRLDDAEQADKGARGAFDRARDGLADLAPPAPRRDDVAQDWRDLATWAAEREPEEARAAAEATERATRAGEERRALGSALVEGCRALGVDPQPSVSQAVLKAHADQQSLLDRIDATLVEIDNVKAQKATADEEHAVSAKLGEHLKATGFEAWILEEAVRELVDGASENLRTLAAGAYSLALDDKSRSFVVVDHRNADERRGVRTLSGGETFLASLALALALSERLADMAAEGARLDAIFLDEGFGTLDGETLEVVGDALAQLSAGGRMVGLVTHVPQIADAVPVRFEVRKGPETSRVERVDT